nr:MAG TPA: hypothetical protein [Caudoviricetes sp.]
MLLVLLLGTIAKTQIVEVIWVVSTAVIKIKVNKK